MPQVVKVREIPRRSDLSLIRIYPLQRRKSYSLDPPIRYHGGHFEPLKKGHQFSRPLFSKQISSNHGNKPSLPPTCSARPHTCQFKYTKNPFTKKPQVFILTLNFAESRLVKVFPLISPPPLPQSPNPPQNLNSKKTQISSAR